MKKINGFDYVFFNELQLEMKRLYRAKGYLFVQKLKKEYPYFDAWYQNLFESLDSLKVDREILFSIIKGDIVGIAILKKNAYERKICTLRVDEKYQRLAIGRNLMEISFEWLGTERPLITVHRSKQYEFEKLFKRYDFKLEERKWCYYRLFNTELVYNGELISQSVLFNINKIEIINMYEYINKFIKQDLNSSSGLLQGYVESWKQRNNCQSRGRYYINYI